MLSEFSPFEPVVEKEGVLSKLGGGAGGHKNWKDRYFVLADHLYYYNSKAEFVSDPQSPLGRVNLLSFYVSKSDPATHEFCVHSYPKVRSAGRTASGGATGRRGAFGPFCVHATLPVRAFSPPTLHPSLSLCHPSTVPDL